MVASEPPAVQNTTDYHRFCIIYAGTNSRASLSAAPPVVLCSQGSIRGAPGAKGPEHFEPLGTAPPAFAWVTRDRHHPDHSS